MSTTLERRKAKKKKAYAEFDEYISYQLRKTQTGIRSTDIFTALCGAAVFVISYLLVFVVLDHWVVAGGFGNGMRAVLLVGMVVGTLAWIGWKVVWPFFRRVNSLYAAKTLEEASPELKSTLLNYVDLRSSEREVSPAIIDSMEKRAAVTLSHAEVDDAIDRSTLLRLSYALLAAVVLFSVYSVVSPKKVWPSIVRIFAPTSEVSVSTQTAFLSVDPGDTKVLAREFLTVTTDLLGEVPEEVTLLFTTNDEQFVDEAVSMREVEAGLKRYQCILKGDSGEGLLQGLSYRIVAGDASTKTYNVTVAQPPSATVDELRYSFPDYMELPSESPTGSNIDTWEGTKIEIAATANMVIESAKLQFSDEAEFPARCEEIRMEVGGDGTSITGLWQPIIRDDGTYPRFYRVQCRTKDGATDLTPVVHSIQIRPDEKPDVSTLQPRGDMEVAVNATVPLLINASDPDFRLSRVVLRAMIGKRQLPHREIYKGADTEERILYELKIASLNAQPGDVITWWAEAHDNRRVETPISTLLDANRSSTPRLKFIVKAPIPEEEAKDQLERDKERAQEKLDELEQRPNGDDLLSDDPNQDMPDGDPDSGEEQSTDADDRQPKADEPETEENSTSEQGSDGDESGTGGKGEGESDSNSDSEGENKTSDETGDSDSQKSETGTDGSDPKGNGSESKPDGSKGESGPRKPVSNDGSQDDEILKELLKQNRDPKPNGAKGEGAKEDSGSDQNSGDDPEGKKPESADPKTGDEDSGTESSASKDGDTKDGSDSEGQNDDSSSKKPGGDPSKEDMPGDGGTNPPKGDEPPKGSGNSEPTENPEKSAGGDDPSKTDDPTGTESGDEPGDPKNGDANKTGKNDGGSDSEKPGEPSGTSESDMPNPDASSDGGGNEDSKGDSSSQSSDDPDAKGESTEPGKSSDGDGGKNSQPGQSSKSDQPGKPGGDSSEGKGGSDSEGGASDSQKGSGNPSAKDSSKSGAGGESSDKLPGGDSSKSPSKDGGKPGGDSASDKPGQSSTEKPGEGGSSDDPKNGEGGQPGKPKGSEAGSEAGKSSDEAGGGKSGKGDSPGEPGGKPGAGDSGGSTINDGAPGSGKSNAKSGKPGQSTGSKSSSSSDPGGEAVASPDDNADPEKAVQRDKSGANPVNQNVKDADEANLEDKLKASNMVLKRLKEELDRGDVDPELLKKLGWTEKDMQKFAERLERQLVQPKPDDPAAEARRRQFEEVLRNVDLESSGREKSGNFNNQKSTNNFSERRLPAPRSHRKAYEDYLKRLSEQSRRSRKPASGK